jgi:hypothetical protein
VVINPWIRERHMRQLIIATTTLIVLTGISSTFALRGQSPSVAHCSALIGNPPCLREGASLHL